MFKRITGSLALIVAVSTITACASTCGGRTTVALDPDATAAFELAAGGAHAVILVRPERWTALRDRLAPLGVTSDVFAFALQSMGDPHAIALGAGGLDGVTELAGLDRSRPFAYGLVFGVEGDLLESAADLAEWAGRAEQDGVFPGVRTRLVLPATDPKALVQAVTKGCEAAGLVVSSSGEGSDPDRAPELCFAFAEAGFVRVEFVRSGSPGRDRKAWIKATHTQVATTSPAPAASAARDHVLASPGALGFWIDQQRMRAAGSHLGAANVASAMAYVDAADHKPMVARGVAEIMSAHGVLAPERGIAAELGVSLVAEPGLQVTFVETLTPLGSKLIGEAMADAGPRLVAREPAPLSLRFGLSLRRLFASMPPIAVDGPDELERMLSECGSACGLAAALDPTVVASRLGALAFDHAMLSTLPPRSVSIDVALAPDTDVALPYIVGAALADDAGGGLAQLVGAMLAAQPGVGVTVDVSPSTTVDAASIVWVGFQRDEPKKGFDEVERESGPHEVLALDVDLGPVYRWLLSDGPNDPALAQLGAMGRASLRVVAHGADRRPSALSGALALLAAGGSSTAPTPPFVEHREVAAFTPRTAAGHCLDRAVHGLARALAAADTVDPEAAPVVIAKAQAAALADLRCAEAGVETRDDAARLRRIASALLPPLPTP
jgi:hypothetical protein